MYYHLVLVVKYRRKVFTDKMSNYAKDIFVRIGKSYNITLEEWNHDVDHIHIMFKAHPNSELSKFINAYKSASSRLIKKFSRSKAEALEGNVLVKKFLSSDNWWCTNKCN